MHCIEVDRTIKELSARQLFKVQKMNIFRMRKKETDGETGRVRDGEGDNREK